MKYFALLTLILVLIISSCAKHTYKDDILIPQGNRSITGIVIDKITGLGLGNVQMYLTACPRPACCDTTGGGIGDPSPGKDCEPSDSTFTDPDGNYRFIFDSSANTDYTVSTLGNSKFCNDSTNYLPVSLADPTGVNFILSPIRILQVNIKVLNSTKNSFYIYGTTTKTNLFHHAVPVIRDANILNFDTTLNLKAIALSNYTLFTEACNFYSGVYTNCNMPINTVLFIENIDTTRVNFTIN